MRVEENKQKEANRKDREGIGGEDRSEDRKRRGEERKNGV